MSKRLKTATDYAVALEKARYDFFRCLKLFEENYAVIPEWKRTIRAISIIAKRSKVEASDLVELLIPDTLN